jgi:hypothetical protein
MPLCETCGAIADHGEHFHHTKRFWCEAHTPWSGHFEHCGDKCADLMRVIGVQGMSCVDPDLSKVFK